MTDIRYERANGDEPEEPVLPSFPVGSREDFTLRDALTRIGQAEHDPALSAQIKKTLDGSQSLRALMSRPEFAVLLEQTSDRIQQGLRDLTPAQREELERRRARTDVREETP